MYKVCSHACTRCYTVSQGHDNFDVLRPELVNGLCWPGEGRELGTVEMNLTSHQLQANQQQQKLASNSEIHCLQTIETSVWAIPDDFSIANEIMRVMICARAQRERQIRGCNIHGSLTGAHNEHYALLVLNNM